MFLKFFHYYFWEVFALSNVYFSLFFGSVSLTSIPYLDDDFCNFSHLLQYISQWMLDFKEDRWA